MRTKLYATLSIVFLLNMGFGCNCESDEDFNPSCKFEEATTDLTWLKEKVAGFESGHQDMIIVSATYQSRTIFEIYPCCLACNYVVDYYSCDGTKITSIDQDAISDPAVIWTTADSDCRN